MSFRAPGWLESLDQSGHLVSLRMKLTYSPKQISISLKILIMLPQGEVKPLCKLISAKGLLKPYYLVKGKKRKKLPRLFCSLKGPLVTFGLMPECVSHNGIDCHNTKSVCQMNADKGMNVSNDNVGKYIQGHTVTWLHVCHHTHTWRVSNYNILLSLITSSVFLIIPEWHYKQVALHVVAFLHHTRSTPY